GLIFLVQLNSIFAMKYILSLICFILFIGSAFSQKKVLTNELIWSSREFSPDYVYSVRSMNDGEHFSALEENKIVKYKYVDFSTSVATIFDGADLNGITIDDYFFNADETKLLVATNVKKVYRRSFTAKYYIVDIATKKFEALY